MVDLEHTGWGPYRSDIMQFAAAAYLYDALAQPHVLTKLDWEFDSDVRTNQKLNPKLPEHFHSSFTRRRLRDAPTFTSVMDTFTTELKKVVDLHPSSQCFFTGHNVYKCEAPVLLNQCAREGLNFINLMDNLRLHHFMDTYDIAVQFARIEKEKEKEKEKEQENEKKEERKERKLNLSALHLELTGQELEGAHDALNDVLGNAALLGCDAYLAAMKDSNIIIARRSSQLLTFAKEQKEFHDQKNASQFEIPSASMRPHEEDVRLIFLLRNLRGDRGVFSPPKS